MEILESLQKKIDNSISGIQDATNRARNVFLFSNLAVTVIFLALFNQEFSWQENINYKKRPYKEYTSTVGVDPSDKSIDELRKEYINMYFERQFFTIPLLGIRCSGSDLTIYAPIAMIIFTTWFFFALRRENHILVDIKSDFDKIRSKIVSGTMENNTDLKNWKILFHRLYRGCTNGFVLVTSTENDYTKKNTHKGKNRIARPIILFLDWLPLTILLVILSTDIRDIIEKGNIMRQHLRQFIELDSFLIIVSCFIAYQIYITRNITQHTQSILADMSNEIKEDLYKYDL